VRQVGPGFDVPGRVAGAAEDDQPRAHVLIDGVEDDLVLPLEVVDAVLLVRKFPAALCALPDKT
jgi:hypothetical protein